MKMLAAIINPSKLDDVRKALFDVGVERITTTTDVKGFGHQEGHTEVYRGMEYKIELNSKIKLEIIVSDEFLDRAIDAIEKSAKTGKDGEIGDGKIYVYNIEEVIRIRTGKRGDDAI